MNGNIKNIISYIKEVIELRNRNIYDIKDYLLSIDYNEFCKKYEGFIKQKADLSILTTGVFLELKYINAKSKKQIPSIPEELKEYINISSEELYENIDKYVQEIKENNGKETKNHYIQELINNNIYKKYVYYLNDLWDIKRYNKRIDEYNDIYMKIYNFYKRATDYEEKIEFILGTDLMLWKSQNNEIIKRHIMEATLKIDVDPFTDTIFFSIDSGLKKGMVSDFLNHKSYNIKDNQALYNHINTFNNQIINEEEINFTEAISKYVNSISYNNSICNDRIENLNPDDIEKEHTYIFNNAHIIIRNKNAKLWVEDLNNILKVCDEEKINSTILNLLDANCKDDTAVENLLNSIDNIDEEDEVLFPLATNNEQHKIVERIRSGNLVLVQGPPGTGKSHTIANLISHFISEGKRVVVTSEKAKALEVVREKLPKEIKSLSLALLSSKEGDKELQFSIEQILKKQEEAENLEQMKENINILDEELKKIRKDKIYNRKQIVDLMDMDTVSHEEALKDIIHGEIQDYNLSSIAKWLNNKKQYNLIPLSDDANIEYNNLTEMFESLNIIADTIKNEKYNITKRVEEKTYLIDNSIEQLIMEVNRINKYEVQNKDLKEAIIFENLNIETINNINKELDILNQINNIFDKNWILENIKYNVFIETILKIKNDIQDYSQKVYKVEKDKIDYSIKYSSEKRESYLNSTNNILNLFSENKKISWINKMLNHNDIKLLNEISITSINSGTNILERKTLEIVNDKLNYDKRINIIKEELCKIFQKDIFSLLNIDTEEFGKSIDKLNDFLNSFLHYSDKINLIDNLIQKMINIKIFNVSYNDTEYQKFKTIILDLKFYATEESYLSEIDRVDDDILRDYKDDDLRYLDNLVVSIRNQDLEKTIIYKEKLKTEINTINRYCNIKETYNYFFEHKKSFIYNYIYEFDNEKRNFVLNNIDNILKYHFVNHYYKLKEDKVKKLPDLFIKRDDLQKIEQAKIIELIELKGWYNQIKKMTSDVMESLGRWINLKKQYRKGTGKNANKILHEMQNEMSVSKDTIPVWIMPVDKLIEQYPFSNNPPFDVLIMDESSQTSILSISALTRGKKVIIVGDDKQISPISVGQSIDEIDNLKTKYLKESPWAYIIETSTSIYDIVQTVCNSKKIVLTEHFRCLPEIINYSRYQFYNGDINPLKVRSAKNTIKKPIMTHYVEEATCKRIGKNPYNIKEIDYIVELIGKIDNDPQYNDKSIGIIVLQNSTKQIQKIRELIMQKYGEKFIQKRNIKVGDSYYFQGDERDVIILSMIISSTDENGDSFRFAALTKEEFDRSFNVAASRAKEQMILIHSVKLEELNPDCNRYKLLNYCQTYDKENQKAIEELFESNFEKDIYFSLKAKNIQLIPQYKVGKYRIDFIVENQEGKNIAIECDGDKYHSTEHFSADLERQTILERCGWKFIRIRASEYYYQKEATIDKIISEIKQYFNLDNSLYNQKTEEYENIQTAKESIDFYDIEDNIFK